MPTDLALKLILKAHKVLIAAAAVLGLVLVVHGVLRYRSDGSTGALVLAGFGAVIAVALGLYFRTIDRRYRSRGNPGGPDQD